MSDRKDISELGNNLANLSVRPRVFIGADPAGELQDVTTLSDTHKRFIRVNDSSASILPPGFKYTEIPEPVFTPSDDLPHLVNHEECSATGEGHRYEWEHIPQEYIDGNENGPGERVLQCQYCGDVKETEKEFLQRARERNFVNEQNSAIDEFMFKHVGRRELILWSVITVILIIAIACHYFFGG